MLPARYCPQLKQPTPGTQPAPPAGPPWPHAPLAVQPAPPLASPCPHVPSAVHNKKTAAAPPARSAFAQSVFEQVEKRNVTAKGGALYLLNGRNPPDLMAAVDQVAPLRELGLLGATGPNGFDGPRLATAFQASLSGLSADGVAAIELLDSYRNYGNDVEGFWRDVVGPISAKRLEQLMRVFDRRVLDSFKKYLEDAPLKVATKVGPILGKLFNPDAKDIELEFRPDQFVVEGPIIKYPSGTGYLADGRRHRAGQGARRRDASGARRPVGIEGRKERSSRRPDQARDVQVGQSRPGRRTFLDAAQIRWGAEIREVDGAKGKEVE
jgi:hypothetical protein